MPGGKELKAGRVRIGFERESEGLPASLPLFSKQW